MNSKPLILGHRGASAVAPENTLAAFSRAIRDGADGIEFDVRLSRDGIPVVIHDASLRRTGLVDKLVAELTAAELQSIDVGRWFAARSKSSFETPPLVNSRQSGGERLPTLAQVFELFRVNSGLLYVEMKCEPREGSALAAEVVRLTRESEVADRVVVESFDLAAVGAVKRIDANIRTAALFEPKLTRPISTLRRLRMIDLARECGADEIALHHTLANRRVIEEAKEEGFEIVVWTVDDPKWVLQARSLGIKALIANNPASMLHHRNALD
jgi:glycerophosphoryl diester phosphodiesterase